LLGDKKLVPPATDLLHFTARAAGQPKTEQSHSEFRDFLKHTYLSSPEIQIDHVLHAAVRKTVDLDILARE
jgi:hypothetical protein